MSEKLKVDVLSPTLKLLKCAVGLPYSGKSTYGLHNCMTRGIPIVNPDSIRVALHGKKFIPTAEPFVWAVAKTMVRALFLSGHDVVYLDATNTTDERRREWISEDWTTQFVNFEVSAEECIRRAIDNGDDCIVPIIESMAEKITYPLGELFGTNPAA